MDWQAVRLSLVLAGLTTGILVGVGIPFSYWLSSSRSKAKFIIEAVIALPLVLPPTVLGFYLLWALGPRSPLGHLCKSLTGGTLPFTFGGLLVGSLLYSFPYAVQPFLAAFSSLDRRAIEASWCLGASRIATFFHVILRSSLHGILTGMILSFAHTLGEFGVVLMMGGNIPGVTRTISISIYDDVQVMNYESAGKSSLFLLSVSFMALALTYGLKARKSAQSSGVFKFI